ncbi:hypothetical protein BGZ61DRAFT_465116 [Ilyonectria robusta]|uniref:uncharacterized protein n=1 Tax=Ilyonectria robusta TaxID=1079257 RepID=UPI001E8E0ABA|nr:uncharacterized protein BGZ61DRAFT_465116 [Ilyonectria robusta]KAH8659546.1 hypothetical protein BGZ61DRAFT_465116 [Ilyonectria robusta]
MMDYIQGQSLKDLGFKKGKKWRSYPRPTEAIAKLHEQLADLYVQLRQLEFPEIGALGLPIVDGKPSYDCDADDIRVCHRPISIEMIMQELEGMNPGARIKPRTTFLTNSQELRRCPVLGGGKRIRQISEGVLWQSGRTADSGRGFVMVCRR